MKTWGIRKKVLFIALVPASAISALLAFYFTTIRFGDLERALVERGIAIARQLAPAAEYGVFSGNRPVLKALTDSALREADVTAVIIRDAQGKTLAVSGHSKAPLPAAAPPAPKQESVQRYGTTLVLAVPVFRSQTALEDFYEGASREGGGARPVLGRVQVELSLNRLIEEKRELLLDSLAITLLGLGAAALLALRLSRSVTRPILNLADAFEKLRAGDLDVRVAPQSAGELRILEKGLNATAAALKAARDHLERRVAEATAELAVKKEQAEEANQAKSRFLAAASHDLRQPVHALGLFVSQLKERLGGPSCLPDLTRLLHQIDTALDATESLLDSLLEISKLDAGALVPNIAPFPAAALLERVEDQFFALAAGKGLRLQVVPSRLWILSDRLALERILQNLVSNAIRYTRRGGVVIGCRRRGNKVLIQVWDTGIGIPKEEQRKIFQEFYQAANLQGGSRRGLGLGLAIVQRLAELLHHRIEVVSVPGQGSVFSVEVELSLPRALPAKPVQLQAGGTVFASASILVVDDDALVRESTRGVLEGWGCRVLTAASGTEALAQVRSAGAPDAILCDYRLLNGETGTEVIEALRLALGKAVPAIIVSGDAAPQALREARDSSCPVLHKPLKPARLRALLASVLARRQLPGGKL